MGIASQLLWQKKLSPAKHYPHFPSPKDEKTQLQKVPKISVASPAEHASPVLENLVPAGLQGSEMWAAFPSPAPHRLARQPQ